MQLTLILERLKALELENMHRKQDISSLNRTIMMMQVTIRELESRLEDDYEDIGESSGPYW